MQSGLQSQAAGLEVTLTHTPSHLVSYAHRKGARKLNYQPDRRTQADLACDSM